MVNPANVLDQTNNFLTSAYNLTSIETFKELLDFCRQWCDSVGKRFSVVEVDTVLVSLPPMNFSIANFYLMTVKYNKLSDQMQFLGFLVELDGAVAQYDQNQIVFAADYYCTFFKRISVDAIRHGFPLHAIALISHAILKLTGGSTGQLTNLHESLFCLCLKARHFDAALPFMKPNPQEIYVTGSAANFEGNMPGTSFAVDKPGPSSVYKPALNLTKLKFNSKSVLLYFYYGGLILCAVERLEEALLFFEHGICLPAGRLSAIMLQSFKSYIMISLILGYGDPINRLPAYKSPVISRQAIPLSICYVNLVKLIKKLRETKQDTSTAVQNYLVGNQNVFEADKNVGLMKQLVTSLKHAALKRLGKIFIALNKDDLCKMSSITSSEEAVSLSRHLCDRNLLRISYDMKQQVFNFLAEVPKSVNPKDEEDALKEVVEVAKQIREFTHLVKGNPAYIASNTKYELKEGTLPHPDEPFEDMTPYQARMY